MVNYHDQKSQKKLLKSLFGSVAYSGSPVAASSDLIPKSMFYTAYKKEY